jgi:hypothetical protein
LGWHTSIYGNEKRLEIEAMQLRIDLIPLAGAIVLMSAASTMAVVLIRSMNRAPGEAAPLGATMGLALVVAVWLIGLALLFQALFE